MNTFFSFHNFVGLSGGVNSRATLTKTFEEKDSKYFVENGLSNQQKLLASHISTVGSYLFGKLI